MENIEKCELYSYEHKGYTLQQTSYNWHYMIIKDDKMVMHCQCVKKLTEQEAKEAIEFYLDLIKGGANG